MSRLRWSFKAGSMLAGSPAVGPDGTCYVGCRDRHLYAVAADGSLRWKVATDGPIDAAPCFHPAEFTAFGCYDGRLRALDADGSARWTVDVGAPVMTTPCLDGDDNLWFGADDGRLRACDPAGRLLANIELTDLLAASPIWRDGTLLQADRRLYGSDGTRLTVASEPVVAPAAAASDGTVYLGSWDGFVYAVRDGAVVWNAPVEGQIYAGCAVGPQGQVLATTRAGDVVALAPDGTRLWSRTLGDGVYGTPAIASGGVCFVGCNDNRLYALDLATGEVAWRERVGRDIRSSVALCDDGTVLAASWDWSLYAFDGGAGGPADAPWPQFQRDAARTGRYPAELPAGAPAADSASEG